MKPTPAMMLEAQGAIDTAVAKVAAKYDIHVGLPWLQITLTDRKQFEKKNADK